MTICSHGQFAGRDVLRGASADVGLPTSLLAQIDILVYTKHIPRRRIYYCLLIIHWREIPRTTTPCSDLSSKHCNNNALVHPKPRDRTSMPLRIMAHSDGARTIKRIATAQIGMSGWCPTARPTSHCMCRPLHCKAAASHDCS